MTTQLTLAPDETVRWQGRPAPRCYTFRNWKHSLFGVFFSLPTIFWLLIGRELAAAGQPLWVAWLPVPFVLVSLWLAAGHLFWARLEWDRIFYTITDRHILVHRGVFAPVVHRLPLARLRTVRLRRLGPNLGTLALEQVDGPAILLCCLEYPEVPLGLLQDTQPQDNVKSM